jgi:hypothetical protein
MFLTSKGFKLLLQNFNFKRLGATIRCLDVHLVFGVLATASPLLVPTNTLYVDMLGPPISWLPAAPEKFPRAVYMFPREKSGPNSDKAEKRRKNFLTLYLIHQQALQEKELLAFHPLSDLFKDNSIMRRM